MATTRCAIVIERRNIWRLVRQGLSLTARTKIEIFMEQGTTDSKMWTMLRVWGTKLKQKGKKRPRGWGKMSVIEILWKKRIVWWRKEEVRTFISKEIYWKNYSFVILEIHFHSYFFVVFTERNTVSRRWRTGCTSRFSDSRPLSYPRLSFMKGNLKKGELIFHFPYIILYKNLYDYKFYYF